MYCEHCFTESPDTSPRCIQCGKEFFSDRNTQAPSQLREYKFSFPGIGWFAGAVVGWYSGVYILMLLSGTLVIWWLGKKMLKPSSKIYLSAIAVQSGQVLLISVLMSLLTFVAKALPLSNFFLTLIVDTLIPAAGLVWLALRPGLKPLLFLTVYQVCLLVLNSLNISAMPVGNGDHKALATHILWRLIALFFMWQAFSQLKKTNTRTTESPS